MREKLENLLRSIFSIAGIIAISGGFIVFVILVAAVIIGGEAGGNLAVKANKQIMPYFIKSASIAAMSGLLMFYIKKEHPLSIDNENSNPNKSETQAQKAL